MKNTASEKEVKNIIPFNKECYGCERHEKDIMISINTHFDGDGIMDFFLDQKQAESLHKDLGERIKQNSGLET